MAPTEVEYVRRRASMVDLQLRGRGIRDQRVLAAMGSVPRELFVPERLRDDAYADGALPIGEGQTISQPYMVAITCELANLKGHERVLEVGGGSGYQAAVLGKLAREVVAIERIEPLAMRAKDSLREAGIENVEILVGDGTLGYPPKAPYDRILVAAGAPRIPQPLVDQLAEGGRLVIPVGSRYMQELTVVEKLSNGSLRQVASSPCVFVPLIGDEGWEEDRV